MGRLRNKVTTAEIESALATTNDSIPKAAQLLTDLVGETISPELLRYWARSLDRPEPIKQEPKILVFDIETSPITAYVWGLYNQNIGLPQIKEDWYIICWSAKWLGSDEILNDIGSRVDEERVVLNLWKLLNEADIVVAHNAKKFDVKKVNAKFLEYGLMQPSYYKVVDTLQIAKGNFALTSNKLDYITKLLDGIGKHKTDFDLWKGCMNGDGHALHNMQAYCDQDVLELESVYLQLRGWDSSHPSVGMYNDEASAQCNTCGGTKLELVSEYTTGTSRFPVYQCQECGHQQRGRKSNAPMNKERQVNVR